MTVATCPNSETLAAFARGDLAADELSTVASHVGGCDSCCRALKLVPEDSLARLARAAAAPPTVNSSGPTPASATNPSNGPPDSLAPNRIPLGFVDHPRYRITGQLGAGGMGTVYKAEDQWMGRTIAIKVVSSHLTAKASAVARFRKEIQAAAQLHHQNIIMAHDTGEAGGCQFLVMEFLEGVSLDKLVARKGPLPVPLACMFTRQAALGLQHAAGKGMVHRDIKPQNLMVTRKGQVKILDFGLARFASAEAEESAPAPRVPFGAGQAPANAGVTNPNLLMGTPDYLSPEQAKNSHDVDPRSDIYSLGCTLYFLLTGKPPFIDSATLIDKLVAHTQGEPPPIREARFDVTGDVAAILAKMMAKRPEDRYQTAAEVAAALLPHTRSDSPREEEPNFEVVEEAAPAPRVAPKPAPLRAEFAEYDTDAERATATLSDTPRPKRVKKPKRKLLPWWQRHMGKLIGGGIAGALLAAALVVASSIAKKPAEPGPTAAAKNNPVDAVPPKVETDDTTAKPKDTWIPPTVIEPPRSGPKILYVLPSNGVWLHDYTDVRKRLEEKGATVVTASHAGGSSAAHADLPGAAVPIDVKLSASMDLTDYAAVVFAGASVDEYMFFDRGSRAAGEVIRKMQASRKPVAAICMGQAVLAAHGALKGKKAADCDPLRRKFPFLTGKSSGITWDNPGVTVDGKLVTASGGRESREFADAIMKAIGQ